MTNTPEPTAVQTPIEAAAWLPASIAASLVQFDSLPDSAHVRLPIVTALHGIGPATVWRWVKAGRLPAPVKLGPKVTAWRVGELRRALAHPGTTTTKAKA